MRQLIIKLVLPLMLLTAVANAQDTEKSGWYMGLGYGSTAYSDDDLGKDTVGMGDLDEDTDSGVVIYGGYKINNLLSIEGSYRDYGEFTYKGSSNTTLEASSIAVSANLGYPFLDNQLRPFAILGVGYVSTDYTNSSFASVDDGAGSLHIGFGVEYEPNSIEGLGFRIAYEADAYTTEVIKIGEDKEYDMALGQLYVGIQYRF